MEAGFIALVVLMAILCVVAGMHIEKAMTKRRNNQSIQGVLNIVCDNPEYEPQLFLQLVVPIEDVIGRKQTTFDVNTIQ